MASRRRFGASESSPHFFCLRISKRAYMDLRVYYQSIRKIEAEIKDPVVVGVSHATEDGGKAGIRTDVPKRLAAKLITEGKARLATAGEAAEFRTEVEKRW